MIRMMPCTSTIDTFLLNVIGVSHLHLLAMAVFYVSTGTQDSLIITSMRQIQALHVP